MKRTGIAFWLAIWTTVAAVAPLYAAEESEGWSMSIGYSNRRIKSADFNSQKLLNDNFRNFNGGDQYTTFAVDPNNSGDWHVTSNTDVIGQITNPDTIFADDATWNGDEESDDADGIVLSMSCPLSDDEDDLQLSLDFGLSYFDVDIGVGASASPGSTSGFTVDYDTYTIPAPPPGFQIPVNGGPNVLLLGNTANQLHHSNIALNADVDADVFVLSLGISGSMPIGPVSLSAGIGPSLNIADVDSSFSHRTQIGSTGDFATQNLDDDELEFLFGIYGHIGLSVGLTDSIDLGVAFRYDEVTDDASTDLVDLDLSGESYEVKLTIHF